MSNNVGHPASAAVPRRRRVSSPARVAGVIATLIVSVGFVLAAIQIVMRDSEYKPNVRTITANEVAAFKNLVRIREAQERYLERDWDGDGRRNYAKFFVHLWSSVRTDGTRVPVNLISKELAFAEGTYRSKNGYYFEELHSRETTSGRIVDLDYSEEWALLGLPARDGITGVCVFLADSTGSIYVIKTLDVPEHVPADPLAHGWTKVKDVGELKSFQRSIVYYLRK